MAAPVSQPVIARLMAVARVVRRIIGVPDYEVYVAHAACCHPEQPPMTRAEFQRDVLLRRYSTPGNRCC